ncbi:hypothetical protein RND81_08G025800 [Saponaria officinalis]|uniref:Pre-mRNA cleavage factor Im 25 kDa subunit n=1 Tax=Saponaria officinalis TaxID=3572 RepID=A0AAW1J331_SAPOF
MTDDAVVLVNAAAEDDVAAEHVVDIFPLSGYYFGSSLNPLFLKDHSLSRFRANYEARGLRTCVQAVILVELFKHPHILLLQVKNSSFKLPGGRLGIGEQDIEGLRRKLSRKLSLDDGDNEAEWEVRECLGMWWKPDFETLFYPYLPPNIKSPKECAKLFLVKLPVSHKFIVPKNMKLLAVPLCQLHGNDKARYDFLYSFIAPTI